MSHFKAKMHQILFLESIRSLVRPSLRWSLTLCENRTHKRTKTNRTTSVRVLCQLFSIPRSTHTRARARATGASIGVNLLDDIKSSRVSGREVAPLLCRRFGDDRLLPPTGGPNSRRSRDYRRDLTRDLVAVVRQ